MGCDIHMVVQSRDSKFSPWKTVSANVDCMDCKGTGKSTYDRHDGTDACYWCKGSGKQYTYQGRNYCLFGQLANVRNGSGFAGCDTGDGFRPIAMPRGYPEDIQFDKHFEDEIEGTWMGDHSHSWLTLSELLTYGLEQDTKCRGIVNVDQYCIWDGVSAPSSWCGGISGPGVRVGRPIDVDMGMDCTHVKIEWKETYRSVAEYFWNTFVPALQKLGEPENVRIVFGFDS